jgi:hypothetical protein
MLLALLALPMFALSVVAQAAAPKVARAARLSRAIVRRIEVSPLLVEVKVSNAAARFCPSAIFIGQTHTGSSVLQAKNDRTRHSCAESYA